MTVQFWPLSIAAGIMRFWVKRAQAYADKFEELAVRRDIHAFSPGAMNHAVLSKSEESDTHPEVIKPVRHTPLKALAAPAARPKRPFAKPMDATAKRKSMGAKRRAATATRKSVGAQPAKKARKG